MSDGTAVDLNELQKRLGYSFKDVSLLAEAMTHSSYAYEYGNRSGAQTFSNERFEFMGDAVLHLVLTEFLMKTYQTEDEGQLSALRSYCESGPFLSALATRLDIGPYIKFGKGEELSGGKFKESLLADTMEAVIAAIHFDGGYDSAKSFILGLIMEDITAVHDKELHIDSKSELQMITQKNFKNMPEYAVVGEEGPEHDKLFTVLVKINADGTPYEAEGKGKNKKAAEKDAARNLLVKVKGL